MLGNTTIIKVKLSKSYMRISCHLRLFTFVVFGIPQVPCCSSYTVHCWAKPSSDGSRPHLTPVHWWLPGLPHHAPRLSVTHQLTLADLPALSTTWQLSASWTWQKTQVLWLGSKYQVDKIAIQHVPVLSISVKVANTACDLLGVFNDRSLTTSDHVAAVCALPTCTFISDRYAWSLFTDGQKVVSAGLHYTSPGLF